MDVDATHCCKENATDWPRVSQAAEYASIAKPRHLP